MKKLLFLICFLFTFAVSAQTATEYFNLAQEQASKRKHYKAIPNYKKAIEKDSTNLDYYWHLSKSILNENVRGPHRTDVGVFEALTVLDKLKHKNPSVKVYERIATANKYVLEDYYLRYQKTAADLVKEKESFKSIALNAYKEIVKSCHLILEDNSANKFAKSTLKYLKAPKF